MEGYLTAMFYSYANNWLSGEKDIDYVAYLIRVLLKIRQNW